MEKSLGEMVNESASEGRPVLTLDNIRFTETPPSRRVFRRLIALLWATLLIVGVVGSPRPTYADAVRDAQWHLSFLRIQEVHRITRGEGVIVAVIDSGVNGNHPDLAGAVLEGRNMIEGIATAWDDNDGHGTAMASLIAGQGHGPNHQNGVLGIAPDAKILPIRVMNISDRGTGDIDAIADGIRWAVDHGAQVINISLPLSDISSYRNAVNYALENDAVVVTSAGNTRQGDTYVNPIARSTGVIAVSGVDRQGFFTPESVSGPEVVLAAPCVDIIVATSGERAVNGEYTLSTGTSDSAALVSGVAALVRSAFPELDAANVINRLIQTADDRGPQGHDPEYGYGIVDPLAALTEDVPTVTTNPLDPNTDNTTPNNPTNNAADDPTPHNNENTDINPLLLTGFIVATLTLITGLTLLAIHHRHSR